MNNDFEYNVFPKQFTVSYLTDCDSDSFYETDYDYEDLRYSLHFFQLNNWLKFSFKYYHKYKCVADIYIMDDGEEMCEEKFYKLKILNDLMKEFNIEKNTFNWDFNFEKYEL